MGRKPGKADINENPSIGDHILLILAMQYKIYNKLRKSIESNDQDMNDNLTPANEDLADRMNSVAVKEENVESPPVRSKTRPKSRIATGIMSNQVQNIRPITPKKTVTPKLGNVRYD